MLVKDALPAMMQMHTLNPEAKIVFVFGKGNNVKYIEPQCLEVDYRQYLDRNTLIQDQETVMIDLGEV